MHLHASKSPYYKLSTPVASAVWEATQKKHWKPWQTLAYRIAICVTGLFPLIYALDASVGNLTRLTVLNSLIALKRGIHHLTSSKSRHPKLAVFTKHLTLKTVGIAAGLCVAGVVGRKVYTHFHK